MSVYVYALLGAPPRGPLGSGIRGEPLRAVACGPLVAVVGDMDEAPTPSPTALRDHDAAIRRMASVEDAVLPVRFGSLMREEHEVVRRLEPVEAALASALALVAGSEQMTLRLYERGPSRSSAQPELAGLGPGARYLAERQWARGSSPVRSGAIQALRVDLASLVRAERLESHEASPLIASIHHLIARGEATRYRSAVDATQAKLDGVAVAVSGPWPPYAFAAEEPA